MRHKLWDTESGTLNGIYAREDEVAALVRVLVSSYGADVADDLELIVETDEGEPRGNYRGIELIARVEDLTADRGRADLHLGDALLPNQVPSGYGGGSEGGLPLTAHSKGGGVLDEPGRSSRA